MVRAPSDGYVTQVLMRPGTYAAVAAVLRPADGVYTRIRNGKSWRSSGRTRCCAWRPAMMRKWCLTPCRARCSAASWLPSARPFPGGTYQFDRGACRSFNLARPGSDGVIATIELDEHTWM